jgi:succinate-acetate transporter protein
MITLIEKKTFIISSFFIISLLILLNHLTITHPIIKYPIILITLILSFYWNPYKLILLIIDKKTTIRQKIAEIIYTIVLSVIYSFFIILFFTNDKNVIMFGKIIGIFCGLYAIILYFQKVETNKIYLYISMGMLLSGLLHFIS